MDEATEGRPGGAATHLRLPRAEPSHRLRLGRGSQRVVVVLVQEPPPLLHVAGNGRGLDRAYIGAL